MFVFEFMIMCTAILNFDIKRVENMQKLYVFAVLLLMCLFVMVEGSIKMILSLFHYTEIDNKNLRKVNRPDNVIFCLS